MLLKNFPLYGSNKTVWFNIELFPVRSLYCSFISVEICDLITVATEVSSKLRVYTALLLVICGCTDRFYSHRLLCEIWGFPMPWMSGVGGVAYNNGTSNKFKTFFKIQTFSGKNFITATLYDHQTSFLFGYFMNILYSMSLWVQS